MIVIKTRFYIGAFDEITYTNGHTQRYFVHI